MFLELEWDEIYKKQGEVQYDVLPTAVMAVELFKKENVKTVLDLGCGIGRHSIFLAQQGFRVTATDISEKTIETTKQKAKDLGLNIQSMRHDMRNIPFENGGIICWIIISIFFIVMKMQVILQIYLI